MPDIFGREQNYVPMDFTTSDKMILQVGLIPPGTEYLVQNVAGQYNQPLNRIFEIGSSNTHFANGRPIGTLQIGRIIGRRYITELFGPTGTGPWSTDLSKGTPASRTIIFKKRGGTGGGADIQYIITGAVIESYGFATDANGLLIQENISMQFAGLIFGFGSSEADQVEASAVGALAAAGL
jgi:hypothetical protein